MSITIEDILIEVETNPGGGPTYYIEIEGQDTLYQITDYTPAGGTINLSLTSNDSWDSSITSDPDSMIDSRSPWFGTGNQTISITINENTTEYNRNCSIRYTCDSDSGVYIDLTIGQEGNA